MENNGEKTQLIKDVATLQSQVETIGKQQERYHKEIIGKFDKLTTKVNEEITTMQSSIKSNRKFLLRTIMVTFVVGTFLWVEETRNWIMRNVFHFVP